MKKGDTRGLSTIVATLLIILLVIVAIAIVWGVVRTVIIKNSEQISLGKLTIDLEIVSIKQTAENVNIKVKRNAGEGDIGGLTFFIFDGTDTYTYEKKNITLNPLEIKTFVVDYQGKIVSISLYPIFRTSSGKETAGNLADIYYASSIGDEISPNCTINCTNKECGDNSCGGSCGTCSGSTPNCNSLGICTSEDVGDPNCSCSATTCVGSTCPDGVGGSCIGTLEPDCNNNQIMCGDSLNPCGNCGICDNGYYCNGGVCSPTCSIDDCGLRECGALPERIDCGESFCGLCIGAGETCNETSGTCEVCTPNCGVQECGIDPICSTSCGTCTIEGETCNETSGDCFACIPQCEGKECGDNECGGVCGTCNTEIGEYCNLSGQCFADTFVNNGTIRSVWPLPIGRRYFDSEDLPRFGPNYAGYFVKIISDYERCLQILTMEFPISSEEYTVIQVSMGPTDIDSGNSYEIWETYLGCTSS